MTGRVPIAGRFAVWPRPACVYCGRNARTIVHGAHVCSFHADLPARDPAYGLVPALERAAA
jgi:hypothetical protein